MLRHLHHPGSENTLGTVERWKGLRQLRHMSADGRISLYQDHFVTGICYIKAGLNASNTSPNHQRPFGNGNLDGFKRFVLFHLFNQHLYQVNGLFGSLFTFFVYPRTMLTQVRHFTKVGIQPGLCTSPAEGWFVHARRTGTYHYPIQTIFFYSLLDESLSGIRTHVFVVDGVSYPFHSANLPCNTFDIDGGTDIFAAVTNKYSDL